MKFGKAFLVCALLSFPLSALAEEGGSFASKETTCKQDKNVRKVKLGYKDETKGSDCQVSYLKETEEPNAEKVLWTAQQQPDFCKEKADGFVEKLKNMGWACE